MSNEQIKFIDRLYKDLYLSDSLKKHTTLKDKYQSIKEYIIMLEEIHNKMIEHNHIDTLKRMYHDKYVIKEENIPDSFYKGQQQAAFEMGYGNIEVGEREKKELNKILIADQKESLDIWLDYFLSEDSNYIPFWAKYWAFQGMLKLGSFDNEKGKYSKRTKTTVTKFADLNREALALSIDTLLKYLNKETIDDKELEKIIKTGSFQSIYTYITNKILNNNSNIIKRNEGKWIKYNKGNNYIPLVNSLQGYNTGWCTAGAETAKLQLSKGDFYVYYTLDENDEYKVPRIAIRMEGNSIGEIRGIANHQNLEPEMEEIVKEKIKDFKDGDKYYKKVSDMKTLTEIYKKHQNNLELAKEDLRFLYEIDGKIEGFGWKDDPRIEEILKNRDIKKDIAYTLNIKKSQIALYDHDLNSDTIYLHNSIHDALYRKNVPEIVRGDLWATGVFSASHGFLSGRVSFPKRVNGTVYLSNVEQLESCILPEIVGGSLLLNTVKYLSNVTFPKEVEGELLINSLETTNKLILPKKVGSTLNLGNLMYAESLILPEEVGGDVNLYSLMRAKELVLPKKVGGNLCIAIKKMKSIILPEEVGGDVVLRNLKCRNIVLPKKCNGIVVLESMSHLAKELIPNPLTYNIKLKNYVITPENVEEYKNSKSLQK